LDQDAKIIVNLARGNVVCEHLVIADRAGLRMRGLLGREFLPAGEGMLLQPAPSIHTAFMRFPIDVVFIDGTLRVKKIVEELRPWRVASARRAWGVLELAEGEVARRMIGIGDQLGVVEITDELGAVENKVAWHHGSWGLIANGGEAAATTNGASARLEASADEETIATRVLVVGSDRRFRSVAAALLTRRGCNVTLGDRTENIGALARREQAEVVVLDAGLSLTETARSAAQIETLEKPVGLVVVGEDPAMGLATLPVLPKWGSFDGLYDAITEARPVRASTVGNAGGN
jgi:uncharacterized membrane protein (UPF0127 family)/CheY-like chemotaxis protein